MKKNQGYSINIREVIGARVTRGAEVTKLIGKPRVKIVENVGEPSLDNRVHCTVACGERGLMWVGVN